MYGGDRFFELAVAELQEKVRPGGALPEENFRLLLVGSACYVNFRLFAGLFDTWGGSFVHNRYLTYASGGVEQGIHYDLRHPIESLAAEMVRSNCESLAMFFTEDWETRAIRDWAVGGVVFPRGQILPDRFHKPGGHAQLAYPPAGALRAERSDLVDAAEFFLLKGTSGKRSNTFLPSPLPAHATPHLRHQA